jgi:hypothetical protein
LACGCSTAGSGKRTKPPIAFAMYNAASTAAAIKHCRRTTRTFPNPVRNPGLPRAHRQKSRSSSANIGTDTAGCRHTATPGSISREMRECGSPHRNKLLKNLSRCAHTLELARTAAACERILRGTLTGAPVSCIGALPPDPKKQLPAIAGDRRAPRRVCRVGAPRCGAEARFESPIAPERRASREMSLRLRQGVRREARRGTARDCP